MAAASFVFTILFWPGLAAAATTPRWEFLSVTVFLFVLVLRVSRITLSHIMLAIFLLYVGISFLWTPVVYDALNSAWKFIALGGVFLIAAEEKSIRPVLIGCALALIVNSIVTIAQYNEIISLQQVTKVGGLFMNKNPSAEIAVMVLVGVLAERMWWAIPGIIPTVYLTDSRGAQLAFITVILAWIGAKLPRLTTLCVCLGCFGVALIYILHSDHSVDQRFSIWLDTLSGFNFWGNGIGSFYSDYPHFATRVDTLLERPDHAHNDLLEIIFELGIGAVFALAFCAACYRARLATERSILLAFAVESLFGFPLYMPATAALFFFASGRLAGSGPALRDDIMLGRNLLFSGVVVLKRFFNQESISGNGGTNIPPGVPH